MNKPLGRKISAIDPWLSVSTLGLVLMGIIMVYSSSSLMAADRYGDAFFFLKKHFISLMIGTGLLLTFLFVRIRTLRSFSYLWLALVGVLLLLPELSMFSVRANHAARWVNLAGFSFQPSELIKPMFIIFVAAYLSKRGKEIEDFRHGLLPLLLTSAALFCMILRQPDFGTTVVLAMVLGFMIFMAGAKWGHLLPLGILAAGASIFLVLSSDYRKKRLLTFLNPWEDPKGDGFQIIQSFVAFERGGLSGKGLGDGTQKLFYLPEAHTDFIFSVIAEELGLFGSLATIILFSVFVIQGIRLSYRLQDPFASLLAFGLTIQIGIQAVLNMAVVMGAVPTKGMTLPLISYGGSSLIATLASIGILFSLSSTVTISKNMAKRKVLS